MPHTKRMTVKKYIPICKYFKKMMYKYRQGPDIVDTVVQSEITILDTLRYKSVYGEMCRTVPLSISQNPIKQNRIFIQFIREKRLI